MTPLLKLSEVLKCSHIWNASITLGLRDSLKISGEEVNVPANICRIADLMLWLSQRGEHWEVEFTGNQQLRVAVNLLLIEPDANIKNGDEVAFFSPVTGG